MKVLLIEDDEATAKSVKIALLTQNISCDVEFLGKEGLESSIAHNYDLIILDLILPDMHGYEILLRLRAAKVEVPIFILSGIVDIENKTKALGYGADDYLTKPFDHKELIARIKAAIRRYKAVLPKLDEN